MEPLTEKQIRGSFINCSKGEASRLHLPTEPLAMVRWDALDFLGWVDPRAPQTSYLVVPTDDGLKGVRLRRATSTGRAAKMCSLCLTTHTGSGVTLMAAARAGKAGRDGNTVGLDICSDLECSMYARELLPPPVLTAARETLDVTAKVERLTGNVRAFVARVAA